jgi:hypothetical protein
MLDVQQPIQMAMQGYAQGQGLRAQQQGMEMQRQQMEMQRQQFEMAQQQIQEKQARAQEVQSMMGQFAELVRTGDVKPEDVIQMQFMVPEMAESIQGAYETLSDQQKEGKIQDLSKLAVAMKRNPELAFEMIDERILAAENAGDPQALGVLKAIKSQAEMDPDAVTASVLMELATVMDKDQFENFMTIAMPEAADVPEGFQTLQLRAAAAGFEPGTPEYQRFMENAGPERGSLVEVKVGGEEGEYEKTIGKGQAEQVLAVSDMGVTARRNRQTLNQLDVALSESAAGFEAGFKSLLGDYGIATEGLTEIQAAEALISQLVPAQRPPGSGEMSNKDLDLFKRSLPRLIQTPEGRRKIIENMKAINDYMMAEGDLADQLLDGMITRTEYRGKMRALGNPLADMAAPQQTGRTAAPQKVPENASRYGITAEIWATMSPEEKAVYED